MSRIGFRAHYNHIITHHQRISHAMHLTTCHLYLQIAQLHEDWSVSSVCMCKAQGPVTMMPSVSARAPCQVAWQLRMTIITHVISIHFISFPQIKCTSSACMWAKMAKHYSYTDTRYIYTCVHPVSSVNELYICTSPWLEVMMRHDPTGMVPRIVGWLSSTHRWKHR